MERNFSRWRPRAGLSANLGGPGGRSRLHAYPPPATCWRSSGVCNILNYLVADPARISASISRAHIALILLKLCALCATAGL